MKVEYHVFDVVDFTKSFFDRFCDGVKRKLERISNDVKVYWVNTNLVKDEQDLADQYSLWVGLNYEGIMIRLGDCLYTIPKQVSSGLTFSTSKFLSDKDNRVWHLLKRKDWQDDEYECISTQEGEGKYKGMIGSLTCRIYPKNKPNDHEDFNVSSGLTDLQRQQDPADFIGKQIKVKYLCLSSDGIPLNPTILAIL